jgi:uncharacterized protein (TIGR02145 family)
MKYIRNRVNPLIGVIGVLTILTSCGEHSFEDWLGLDSSSSSGRVSSSSNGSNNGGGGSCDIKDYKTVKIGEQTWMAENLNCNVSGSVCYGNDPVNCAKYGRLYNFETAREACPSGWHLPSSVEWVILINYFEYDKECFGCAGKHLKATSGWNDYKGKSGNGEDTYGFSALPSGSFEDDVGNFGYWWSASDIDSEKALHGYMTYINEYADLLVCVKDTLLSVRCVED